MKTWRLALASFALVSTSGFAAQDCEWEKNMFQRLVAHPAFEATLYKREALIMERDGEFFAAIAVVESTSSALVCAYAAPFDPRLGAELGSHVLKPEYICDSDTNLKPYLGYFEVKIPPCAREICANPAIGVGNLDILPEYDFSLDRLPPRLPVKLIGRFNQPFDATLPVAGGIQFGQ